MATTQDFQTLSFVRSAASASDEEVAGMLRVCGDKASIAFLILSARCSEKEGEKKVHDVSEISHLSRKDLKTFEKRCQYDRWVRGGEKNLHQMASRWLRKKGFSPDFISQAIISFLKNGESHLEIKEEKVPVEFEKCDFPSNKIESHFYIDGTPIPAHSRDKLREYLRTCSDEECEAISTNAHRLFGFNTPDFLIPRKSNGKRHEVRACYAVCRFWRAVYSGLIPGSELFDMCITQQLLTCENKGCVNEDTKNATDNVDFAGARFTGPIPYWFPPETAKLYCENVGLSIEDYDPYMEGEFPVANDHTVEITEVTEEVQEVAEEVSDEENVEEEVQEVEEVPFVELEEVHVCVTESHPLPCLQEESQCEYLCPDLHINKMCYRGENCDLVHFPKPGILYKCRITPQVIGTKWYNHFEGMWPDHIRSKVVGMLMHKLSMSEAKRMVNDHVFLIERARQCLDALGLDFNGRPLKEPLLDDPAIVSFQLEERPVSPMDVDPAIVSVGAVVQCEEPMDWTPTMSAELIRDFNRIWPKKRVIPRMSERACNCVACQTSYLHTSPWCEVFPVHLSVPSSYPFKRDLTMDGDVEKNPGPDDVVDQESTVTTHANATFVDNRDVLTASTLVGPSKSGPDATRSITETPWNRFQEILGKEMFAKSFSWNVSQQVKIFYQIPDLWIKVANAAQLSVWKMFAFYRPSFEVRFVMNSTSFHNGRLICFLEPPYWKSQHVGYNYDNATNFPHVFLDAGISNTATLVIPFIHFLSYFPTRSGVIVKDDNVLLANVSIYSWNTLRAADGSAQSVEVSVFVRMTHCELHQTVPVKPTDKYASNDDGAIQSLEMSLLSLGAGMFSDWAGKFFENFSGGLARGIGSRLAGLLFDKPLDFTPDVAVVNRSVYPPCWGTGGDKSIRLALLPFSQTETLNVQIGGSASDYNLFALMQRPSRLMTIEWKQSVDFDTFGIPVSPCFLPKDHYSSVNAIVTYVPSMLAYCCRPFVYWRGTIVFRIQVVSTRFHSGRLFFVFRPDDTVLNGVFAKEDLASVNYAIIDLQDLSNDFEIECPYMSVRPWLRCDNFRGGLPKDQETNNIGEWYNGMFYIGVLNSLVCPSNVAQSVEINVSIRAGKEFDVSCVNSLMSLSNVKPTSPEFRYVEYPFFIGSNPLPDAPDPDKLLNNLDYYYSLYIEGQNLYRLRKIDYLKNETKVWYDNIEPYANQNFGMDWETMNYMYKVSQMRIEVKKQTSLGKVVGNWPAWQLQHPAPSVLTQTQGNDQVPLSEDSPNMSAIDITKGHSDKSIAAITVGENSLNLQTVLRRYYPVFNSYPISSGSGYTVFVIPVSPGLVPTFVKPPPDVGDLRNTTPISWFSKLYTYWRGSMRYMINFSNAAVEVFAWHIPQDTYKWQILTGVNATVVQQAMSYSGTLAMTHVQGSLQVEVPFSSPYNQCLIDTSGTVQDLRAQNGTLFFAFRIRSEAQTHTPSPVTCSLFYSTGDDFVFNVLRAPPLVFEVGEILGAGNSSSTKQTIKFPDIWKAHSDNSRRQNLPCNPPYNVYQRQTWFYRMEVDKSSGAVSAVQGYEKDLTKDGDVESNPGPACLTKLSKASEDVSKFVLDSASTRDSLKECAEQMTAILQQVEESQSIPSLQESLKKISAFTDLMTNHTEKLTTIADGSIEVASRYAICAAEIMCIGAALFNLRRCLEQPTLGNFLTFGVTVAGCFGIACSASIQHLIRSLVNWVVQIPNVITERSRAQASYETAADWLMRHESKLVSVVAVFGVILYSYIFGVIPPLEKIKASIRSFFESDEEVKEDVAKAQAIDLRAAHFSVLGITALDKVYQKIMGYVQRFLDWILERDNPEVILARKAQEIRETVLNLAKELDDLDNLDLMLLAQRDWRTHNRFYAMRDTVDHLTDFCIKEKVDARVLTIVTECRRRVTKLLRDLNAIHVQPLQRYTPHCLYLVGDPGCGKSYSMGLWTDLYKQEMGLADYNLKYSKQIDEEFWSGYCQQPIVVWDEFCGNTDADKKLGQFMQLNSNQPTIVPMADLKDKGMPFTSQAIIIGSNIPFPEPNCVRDKLALWRRRQLLISCTFAEGYDATRVQNLTTEEGRRMEHILFRALHPCKKTPEFLTNWLTFEEMKEWARPQIQAWHAKQLTELEDLPPTALPREVIVVPQVDGEDMPEEDQAALAADIINMYIADGIEEANEMMILNAAAEANDGEEVPLVQALSTRFKQYLTLKNLAFCVTNPESTVHEVTLASAFALDRFYDEDLSFQAISWALWKCSVKPEGRLLRKRVEAFFGSLSDKIKQFWQDHPNIIKALGVLTLCVTVGGVLSVFHESSDSPAIESHYDVQTRVSKQIKVLEGAYQPTAKQQTTSHVLEGAIYDTAMRHRAVQKVIEGSSDPTANDIQKAFHSLVGVVHWLDGSNGRTMRAFHVKGHCILVPRHFMTKAEAGDKFAFMKLNVTYTLEFDPTNLKMCGTNDWCVYNAGVRVSPARDCTKYFISQDDLGKLSGNFQVGLCSIDDNLTLTTRYATCKSVKSYEYEDPKFGETYKQVGFQSTISTQPGDCGAPLIAYSTSIPAPGKILGVHTAGKSGKNEAFAVLVSRESLTSILETFKHVLPPSKVEGLDPERPISECRIVPKGEFSIIGVMPNKKCLAQPVKTSFRKTPWFDLVSAEMPPPKLPAMLRPFEDPLTGLRISPLSKALAKYGTHTEPFPHKIVNKITSHLACYFQNKCKNHNGKRIFSEQEAIMGIDGLEFADRMNMKSSPGWPYQIIDKEKPGKWHLFDDEGNICCPELSQRLHERIEAAKDLKRVSSIWRDCQKDELRSIQKVQEGSTRLFTIAPCDFTICVRQYFLDFVCSFYSSNCSDFFSAVGMNPESFDWTNLYSWLREYGKDTIAADFSKFDGTLAPEFMMLCCEVINMWYDDSVENQNVRRVMFEELIHTYQLVENCVYQTHKGNPSGNPLTVVVNTIVGHCYLLVCWLVLCPEYTLNDFYKYVRVIHYGDDFLAVVKPIVSKRYNFVSVRDCLNEFGITLTLDTKIVGNEEAFKDLDTCTFLKRGFRKDPEFGMSLILPTMSLDTINSFFYFYRKSEDVEAQLQENMRACLVFACFHGRDFYNSLLEKWKRLFHSVHFECEVVSFEEQVDVFLCSCGVLSHSYSNLIAKFAKRSVESHSEVKFGSSRLARALNAAVTAPLYYLTAPFGSTVPREKVTRSDDRWAVAIPSGEGKTWLATKYPEVFLDQDDLIMPDFEISLKHVAKNGLPWFNRKKAREYDVPSSDRRILLTHHPDNTKRQIIGSFITPSPSFVRANTCMRLALRNPIKMSMQARNSYLLEIAKVLEPQLFES